MADCHFEIRIDSAVLHSNFAMGPPARALAHLMHPTDNPRPWWRLRNHGNRARMMEHFAAQMALNDDGESDMIAVAGGELLGL